MVYVLKVTPRKGSNSVSTFFVSEFLATSRVKLKSILQEKLNLKVNNMYIQFHGTRSVDSSRRHFFFFSSIVVLSSLSKKYTVTYRCLSQTTTFVL